MTEHRTRIIQINGHNPAEAQCLCGWWYSGGGYYRCLVVAQSHRFEAMERGESVTYEA